MCASFFLKKYIKRKLKNYEKYPTIFLFVTFAMTISCNKQKTKQITGANLYQAYLEIDQNKGLKIASEQLKFWKKKLVKMINQYPYNLKMASANSQIF
jgi:hypothetical protein